MLFKISKLGVENFRVILSLCTILKISRKIPWTTIMFIDDEAGLKQGDGTFACRGIVNATLSDYSSSRIDGVLFVN